MARERWRAITRSGGRLEVSDRGNVRRAYNHQPAAVWLSGKRRKYRTVSVGGRYVAVSALVLEEFVGARPTGMLALHANDIATDNNLRNLRWGSRRDNWADAVRNGRCPRLLKTTCPYGHDYDRVRRTRSGRTWRACSTCTRDSKRRCLAGIRSRRAQAVTA
ncbi:HNH endonuclease [Mycobacteroides salmoniphilum]|uniref:HNH nuclease domain-containing protein n=1 Tax=Mycobacteroides salmoniphilum TaxID=404941 RepID=A0A4R8SHI5_9MYCO|nr:HNH endonuclease [Mycobacteroides salmoniphilum]TDZ96340.1 hypothetical protein CCUG60885_02484 [Mycobacteroides salmoniphilum]TEA05435.1 hypothetical protein CCUG60883_02741 [Mycobacteroides salmoniphilum]